MITAVDTNVLLDVMTADRRFGSASRAALARCLQEGGLVACEVVWAETAAAFPSRKAFDRAVETLGLAFGAMDAPAATLAGMTWRRYREAGGTRRRILADFLIGAHADMHAERLLTRDRGFYRSCFSRLAILEP
ncbi:MAG: type II toxin-antitoxin system VapC family toxin [Chloroflexota bacterium]